LEEKSAKPDPRKVYSNPNPKILFSALPPPRRRPSTAKTEMMKAERYFNKKRHF
jgi:hypothetical protein